MWRFTLLFFFYLFVFQKAEAFKGIANWTQRSANSGITTLAQQISSDAGYTIVLNITSTVPAGSLVVVTGAGGRSSNISVSDSQTNTWVEAATRTGGGGGSPVAAIFHSRLTNALSSGDTITVDFSSGSAGYERGAWAFIANGMTAMDQSGSTTLSNVTSISVSTSGSVTSSDELLVGVTAEDCNSTIDPTGGYIEGMEHQGSISFSAAVQSATGISGTQSFTATSGTACRWGVVLVTYHNVPIVAPSSLSLSHSTRSRQVTVSWTGGSGNNGTDGCRLQFQKADSSWANGSLMNCDQDVNTSTNLPGDNWYGGSWSSAAVRLIRVADNVVLGTFPGNVTCSSTSSSSGPSPNIDEDCDSYWDDIVGCSSFNWVYQTTWNSSFTACTNATTYSTRACNLSSMNQKSYTDGTGTGNTPATVWSSSMFGSGCTGSYTGAVEWLCVGSSCTYN